MIRIKNRYYYSIADVADMLEVEEKTIWKRIKDGVIKSIKKSGWRYISDIELEKIMGPDEIIIPERFPDCIKYEACIDKYARNEDKKRRTFGCRICREYKKVDLIGRDWVAA